MFAPSEAEQALTHAGVAPEHQPDAATKLGQIDGRLQRHFVVVQRLAARGQCIGLFQEFLKGQKIPYDVDAWAGAEAW